MAGGAGPAGAPGTPRPQTKRIAHDNRSAVGFTSQLDRDAVEAALPTLSHADRQHLAALLAAYHVAAEAERDLTPEQAAHELQVSSSTARAWCASGRIGHRVGGRWRIAPAEVRALLQEGRS